MTPELRHRCTLFVGLGLIIAATVSCRTNRPQTARARPVKGPGIDLYQAPGGKGKISKDVVVQRRDTVVRFAPNGAATRVYRMRVKLLTKAGVRSWQFFTAAWSPWFERRPKLTVRIKTPSGKILTLDQSTVAVETARPNNWSTLSDRKRLRAPLPGVCVGAHIDLTLVLQEKRPRLGKGDLLRVSLAPVMPTKVHHLTIEAPVSLALKWQVRGLSLKPRSDRTKGGIRRVVFQAGPFEKNPLWEPFLPPDAARYPHVQISTVRTWREVAAVYYKLVKGQLRSRAAAAVVRDVRKSGARSRLRVIAALLARLRKKVRYTALVFGRGAIKPRKPAVTTKRGYGDCKDMSSLLVAWLHAAGIPAHLALVRSGSTDLRPRLPGLAAFNHAIVYVPGPTPLWIDPTARYTTAQLPPHWLQNHWALVIRPQTTGLTRIPASKAADNVYTELREVRFAPQVGGRVVEDTRATGYFQRRLRRLVGSREPTALRKTIKSYILRNYYSDKLVAIRHGNATRLDRPFRFRVEMKRADVAWTDDNHAKLKLSTSILWNKVPNILAHPPKVGSKQDKRKRDLYFKVPHQAKLTYRVVPPPEYVLVSRPESGSHTLGPARFSWQVKHNKKTEEVEIVYHLDTGPRRYRPKDVKAFWRDMRRFKHAPRIKQVIYEHRGRRLHKAGKLKATLAVYRDLLKRWPKNGTYYRQLANFYSSLGYGQKARRLMRDAVRRLPKSPVVSYTLGYHLERNDLGQDSTRNWDRKATIAAYRRAQQLDPKNAYYPRALGRVLSIDSRNNDLTTAKALRPALKVLLAMRKKHKETSMDNRIARLLLYSRRHAELRRHVRLLSKGTYRTAIAVANVALEKGYSAGIALARRLAPEDKDFKAVAGQTGQEILRLSEYKLARRFIALGIGDTLEERARALVVQKIRSMDYLSKPVQSPVHAAMRLYWLAYGGRLTKQQFDRLAAKRLRGATRKIIFTALAKISEKIRSKSTGSLDFPPRVMGDMVMSMWNPKVTGNDRLGYRVVLGAPTQAIKLAVYVIKSGGQYRIRSLGLTQSELGAEALWLLKKRRVAHAKQWLDWARGEKEAPSDPLQGAAFDQFYRLGRKPSRSRLRVAAAFLAAQSKPRQKLAIRIIERALRKRPSKADKVQMERMLQEAYTEQKQWSKVTRITRKLLKLSGNKRFFYLKHLSCLLLAKQTREAVRLTKKWQKDEPTRWESYVALAQVALFRGRHKDGLKQLMRATTAANVPFGVYNDLAWTALFVKPFAPKSAIQHALMGVRLSKYRSSATLHTLATLYAEAGQLHSARLALFKSLEVDGRNQLESADWYPYGRIAEELGFLDVAIASYRRVNKPKQLDNTSTWLLAQRRLKLLRKRKPRPPR